MPETKPYLKNLYRTIPNEKTRRGCLRLDMNEGVPGLPRGFIDEVLSEITPELLSTYPEYTKLQERIAAHNKLPLQNICLSNGSDAAIKYIFEAYISPGDKILLTDPTFAMYPVYCHMFNAIPEIVEYEQDFSFPFDAFYNKVTSDVKLAVIVNPNNPTGSTLDYQRIISIIEKAIKNDVLVIVDEAYFYFYPETIIDQVSNYNNLIVLRTFSKLCSIAAVRLGYAAACSEIIENLRKVKPTFDVNGIAILFAEKILDNSNLIKSMINNVNEGKEYIRQKLLSEGISFKVCSGNFLLVDCGDRVNEIITELKKRNVLVNGRFKQNYLNKYIRITVGDKQTMKQFWVNFIKVWRV